MRKLGDPDAGMRWTTVEGIAIVHTDLDPRQVVAGCHDLLCRGEEPFAFAVKWVPVDEWAPTDLDAIKAVIEQKLAPRIGPDETWAMQVEKRRWQRYHTADIVAHLAPAIHRQVDLSHPDKILRVDVIDARTALAVLRPDEIFSAVTAQCPSPAPGKEPGAAHNEGEPAAGAPV